MASLGSAVIMARSLMAVLCFAIVRIGSKHLARSAVDTSSACAAVFAVSDVAASSSLRLEAVAVGGLVAFVSLRVRHKCATARLKWGW